MNACLLMLLLVAPGWSTSLGKALSDAPLKSGLNAEVLLQDGDVKGTVADSTGASLPGVSVIIKDDPATGTSTGADGRYSIKRPENGGVLVFSLIGFKTIEVPIGEKQVVDVVMQPDNATLDQVVVIGYGTQKKVSLTGAVSQIDGRNLERKTTQNVQQSLQGKIPGLTILDEGAAPGRENIYMRIRGITTLSGNNSPLVLIDGVEQQLTDVNPNDIETISVLKDASSTAIYGSRAANGVVLITTRRAEENKLSVSYNGYYAIQKTNNDPEHMGLEDYMRLQNTAWTNSTGSPVYTEEYIREYVNATDRIKYPLPNTWYEAVLNPAPQIENSLAISGGNETVRARLSLRHRDQEGIIANSHSKTTEVRLNTDYKISPAINLTANVNYRYVDNLSPIDENIVFRTMLQTSQWTVPKYPDGTYGISSDGHNPLLYSEIAGTSRTEDEYLLGNFKGDWDIIKGLRFTTHFSAVINPVTGKSFTNRYQIYDYNDPDLLVKTVPRNNLVERRDDTRQITLNNLLYYSTVFNDHHLDVLGGYSQIDYKGRNLSAYRENFYNNRIQSIGEGANDATKSNDGGEYRWGLRSYFGRINYTFKEKYLFEANGRFDGSSRFLKENKYSFFPSFSAGWRISEEAFWGPSLNFLNEFKLRASWGKTGNQAVALYSGLVTLGNTSYSFNNMPVTGYVQYQMANQDLTWETTTQSDIGLDAGFWNNRISLSLDYYYKKTEDILLELPVPGALGLNAPPQNAGRVDNKGWELGMAFRNDFGKVSFNANLNFSINKNEVIDLAGTGPYISSYGNETRWITGEGYPISGFWGYRTDGLFQTEDEVRNYPTLVSGTAPGDVKYLDLNQDGKITADDMTYLGPSFPVHSFGADFNIGYKGLSLNLFLQGASGQYTRLGGALIEMGIWGGFTHEIISGNYWTPENRDARFPRPLKYDLRNFHFSDKDLMKGSYLRLKNVQLAYQLPASIIGKIGLEQVQVYIAGTNLLTFAALNQWNVDPETNDGGRTEIYPQTSLKTIGLNLRL